MSSFYNNFIKYLPARNVFFFFPIDVNCWISSRFGIQICPCWAWNFFKVASLYLSLTCAVMDSMLLIFFSAYITKPFFLETGNFKIRILCHRGTKHWLTSTFFIFYLNFYLSSMTASRSKVFKDTNFLFHLLEKITSTKNSFCLKDFFFCAWRKLKWLLNLYAKVLFQWLDLGALAVLRTSV